MDATRVASRFRSGLLTRLQTLEVEGGEALQHLIGLRSAVASADLAINPIEPSGIQPAWLRSRFFADAGEYRDDELLDAMHCMFPACHWLYAYDFYPQPEHRYFSERVVGATLAGEADAVFHSGARFVALLVAIEPGTTYPMHAHRIEESYLVLAGEAEWSHDGERWLRQGPGGSFHNRSWQAHTIRTGEQGLLSLGLYLPPFGWEGHLL